jgi:hypothetical protein
LITPSAIDKSRRARERRVAAPTSDVDVVALDEALKAAAALEVSTATVERERAVAKAWLRRRLSPAESGASSVRGEHTASLKAIADDVELMYRYGHI